MIELITEIEAATRGSIFLDDKILEAIGERSPYARRPQYTTSIEAAMTLVLPSAVDGDHGRHIELVIADAKNRSYVRINYDHNGSGATPELAICAGALRDRYARMQKKL